MIILQLKSTGTYVLHACPKLDAKSERTADA